MQAFMLCKGRIVICGDPMQLGATILSEKLKTEKLYKDRLLERLCNNKINFTLLK